MRLFKSINYKIAELGFRRVSENDNLVRYLRHIVIDKGVTEYDHCVELVYNANPDNSYMLYSYKSDIHANIDMPIYEPLSIYESELFIKKAKHKLAKLILRKK